MSRPLLLDLFCGAGGCSMGYHRAGFDVVGVDHKPQPRYPFPERFVQADALNPPFDLKTFDVIHASPPCQDFCAMKHFPGLAKRGNLITATRKLLCSAGVPWVIENVPGAPMQAGVVLCGKMFGLKVYRHRVFEASVALLCPPHVSHRDNCRKRMLSRKGFVTVAGHGGMGIGIGGMEYARQAMGIDWMARDELSQAIPPAYTEFLGRQLLHALETKAGEL